MQPKANPANILTGENCRITLLTDSLIRFEEGPLFLESLAVTMRSAQRSCEIPWTYGKKCENLFGTARTLDTADGPMPTRIRRLPCTR